MAEAGQLSLVIASDDWFWRSVVSLAAHRCNRFHTVIGVEDGYMALAHLWQCVEDRAVPEVFILDARGVDPSLARFVTEARADDATREVFIAAIGDQSQTLLAVDHVGGSCADPDEMIAVLERIANAAVATRSST